MASRRFFYLDEGCPASQVPHMLCRVVADKLLPLHKFAPFEPIDSTTPSHNTDDIIPNILPPPNFSTNRREFIEKVREKEIATALTAFFGLEHGRGKEDKVKLESLMVKRYTLNNPEKYFEKLMENEQYAADVKKVLEDVGHAYLVVGFLTTTGTVWKSKEVHTRSNGFEITAPLGEIAAVPLPGLLDPGVGFTVTNGREHGRSMLVDDEEIFAIAYCKVKLARSFDRSAPKYVRKTPKVGQAKRAKGRHLAFDKDSDEEIEYSDDDDNEEEDAVVIHGIQLSSQDDED